MISFLAQDKHLERGLPDFDFATFEEFNASDNETTCLGRHLMSRAGSGNPASQGIPGCVVRPS